MPPYGKVDYWDQRYTREPSSFDWYQSYAALRHILQQYLAVDQRVLQVGVGTSRIQEEMAKHGYTSITNIDFSAVVIKHMAHQHSHLPSLVYQVADVRQMTDFRDGEFGGILDKGTLDAILSGQASITSSKRMLEECHRVLAPGGNFALVSCGQPASRLRCLTGNKLKWASVTVYCISKADGSDGAHEYEQPPTTTIKGPFAAEDADAMAGLDELVQQVHYVYVLRKPLALQDAPCITSSAG